MGGWGALFNLAPGDAHKRARPSRGAQNANRLQNFTKNPPLDGALW